MHNRQRDKRTEKRNKTSIAGILSDVIKTYKFMTILTMTIIAGAIITSLFPPLVLERIVNSLTEGQEVALHLAFAYFGFLAVSGFLEAGQNVMITVFGQKVTHELRSEMCAKLKRLPASYYIKNEPGKITSRFVNDVDVVDSLFTNGIISMFADACKVISILSVIFYKSTGLGMLMIVLTPFLFLMTRLFQKRMLTAQLANRVAVGKVNNHVPETIRNIRMIHTLFCQQYMEEKYDDYIQESYHAVDQSNLYDSIYSPIIIFISSCVISVMMIGSSLGGNISQFFGITVGTAVAIIAYVGKVFGPLESIGMEIQNIQSAIAGVQRIHEFLQEPEEKSDIQTNEKVKSGKKAERNTLERMTPCVELKQVAFSYDKENPVLKNLSFTIEQGENVTLVGRTGAGKSTIFRLLLGLYHPDQGSVKIDGREAAMIPESERRKLFGYVEQSFHLVSGSIGDQISLFDPSIGTKEIEYAANLVGLHETILAFPKGYDTVAAEASLSQGQYQLLSIARAVAASPSILLLDEITANLDSVTEQKILDALKKAAEGRTVISISHRLHGCMSGERVIEIDSLFGKEPLKCNSVIR
ncbi:MAG: ABC transporter ATP-binding protein [Lachnospiraceae bacterium]|nr:ABC transporter ATP-binding protein [Lachnospiraceae bacterium]